MSKMLRNYQYLVGTSADRSYENESLKDYIEGEVGTAVSNLTNLAPEDLDTIGELAAAIQNNPDFLTTLQARDADLLAAVGIPAGQATMGAMTTTELADDADIKALFEALGEAARRLREGLGVAQGDENMGTFTGSTIPDNSSVKAALQVSGDLRSRQSTSTPTTWLPSTGLAENVLKLTLALSQVPRLSDNLSVKAAFQEIETAIENAGVGDVATEAAAAYRC